MEYKSFHYLTAAFPDLVLWCSSNIQPSYFSSLLCLKYSPTAPWCSFSYFIRLSSSINSSWKLCITVLPLWSPNWVRHLSSMLISTTPVTVVFIIVWLRIFILHSTVSFLRARAMSYFSYSFSYPLYEEQSWSRNVINVQWMNNRLRIIWNGYEEMVNAIQKPNLVNKKWKHSFWAKHSGSLRDKETEPLRVAVSTPPAQPLLL